MMMMMMIMMMIMMMMMIMIMMMGMMMMINDDDDNDDGNNSNTEPEANSTSSACDILPKSRPCALFCFMNLLIVALIMCDESSSAISAALLAMKDPSVSMYKHSPSTPFKA